MFLGSKRRLGSHTRELIIFFALTSILALVFIFINSNFFKIRTVEINLNKANCASEKAVADSLDIYGKNIFFLDGDKKLKVVQDKFPCVGNLNIHQTLPSSVKVAVVGREARLALDLTALPEASISALRQLTEKISSQSAQATSSVFFASSGQSHYLLVDSSGKIFASSDQTVYIPIVEFWNSGLKIGDKLEQKLVSQLLSIFDKLKEFNLPILETRIYPEGVAIVTSSSIILFNLNKDVPHQLAALQLIVTQAKIDEQSSRDSRTKGNMVFIDLRFENPIVKYAPRTK